MSDNLVYYVFNICTALVTFSNGFMTYRVFDDVYIQGLGVLLMIISAGIVIGVVVHVIAVQRARLATLMTV